MSLKMTVKIFKKWLYVTLITVLEIAKKALLEKFYTSMNRSDAVFSMSVDHLLQISVHHIIDERNTYLYLLFHIWEKMLWTSYTNSSLGENLSCN